MLGNASPSTEATNLWTVYDTVDIPGNMDNQPSPQDEPVNVQSDGGQFGGPESIVEAGQETRWGFPLFVFFVLLFFSVAIV